MNVPYQAKAFGLRLLLDGQVAGLDLSDRCAPSNRMTNQHDVIIRSQRRPPVRFTGRARDWSIWYNGPQGGQSGEPIVQVWRLRRRGHFRMRYEDGIEFWVDAAGRQIWLTWPSHRSPEDAAIYLLGPVLGLGL